MPSPETRQVTATSGEPPSTEPGGKIRRPVSMVPDVAVSSFPSDVSVSSFGGAEELGGEKTNG